MNKTLIKAKIPSWILSRDCRFFVFFCRHSLLLTRKNCKYKFFGMEREMCIIHNICAIWQNQGKSSWGRHVLALAYQRQIILQNHTKKNRGHISNLPNAHTDALFLFPSVSVSLSPPLQQHPIASERPKGKKSMSLGFNGNLKIKQVNWHHSDCITYSLAKPVCAQIQRELGKNSWLKFQFCVSA